MVASFRYLVAPKTSKQCVTFYECAILSPKQAINAITQSVTTMTSQVTRHDRQYVRQNVPT